MTAPTRQPDCGLWYARQMIADAPTNDPMAVLAACGWIIQHSDDAQEIEQATALRDLVERKAE